jgi:glyoxylase-like metal-dependent hydrolase (beta-lactamase superfamily II)
MLTAMGAGFDHFRIEEVAPGAWALLAGDTGACVSNAGIIDLGDLTMIVDTFVTPEAGADLHRAARELTGRAAALVVNTHHHEDHMRGNQAFAGADIVATARTIELMQETAPSDMDDYEALIRYWITRLDDQLANLPDGDERSQLMASRTMATAVLHSLPELDITLPTRSFDGELVIDGSERPAHIVTYGGGHTDSDAFVYLPDCEVIFAGDLLWVETHPWAGDGHPDEWINIIYRMKALDPKMVVPGHGTVTDFAYARIFVRYLTFVCDIVRQAEASSLSVVKLAESAIPPQYGDWAATRHYRRTLSTLGTRLGLPPD